MNSSKKIVGKIINNQRKKKGLTLKATGDKLGVDKQYVWKLENGKINMSLNYIDKLIKKLGCRHEDFFNSTNNQS